MKYLSVCSGIEAASVAWHGLGWEPVGFSEIEDFPSAVLKHRFPTVKNYGDMTKFKEWPIERGSFDVLVGGTPCQSFSIAGLRKGLEDPRGNLSLTFLSMVDYFKPRKVIWENVPGALSIKTEDGDFIQIFIDALTQMGYICDIDILDAQYFGLAQRRRRIFIVCERLEDLLKKKTDSSLKIISEIVVSQLLVTWDALQQAYPQGKSRLGLEKKTEPSASLPTKKIQKYEDLWGKSAVTKSLNALEEQLLQYMGELKSSEFQTELLRGKENHIESKMDIDGFFMMEDGDKSIESSWKLIWEELLQIESESTISILTSSTTESKILCFAETAVSILMSITSSMECYLPQKEIEDYWSLAQSILIFLKESTNYARSASSDLFTDPQHCDRWRDYINEATRQDGILAKYFRQRSNRSEIFSFPESLRRDPPPSRKEGERVAGGVEDSSGKCSEQPVLMDQGGSVMSVEDNVSGTLRRETKGHEPIVTQPYKVSGTLQNNGKAAGSMTQQDAESGMAVLSFNNRQDPIHSQDISIPCGAKDNGNAIGYHTTGDGFWKESEESGTLRAREQDSHENVVAFAQNSRDEVREMEVSGALSAEPGMKQTSYLRQGYSVRRLTPEECERLQGFPTGWTRIPWRNKQAEDCPDGPRYKSLGNSMACNVMSWIGQRIQRVEDSQ